MSYVVNNLGGQIDARSLPGGGDKVTASTPLRLCAVVPLESLAVMLRGRDHGAGEMGKEKKENREEKRQLANRREPWNAKETWKRNRGATTAFTDTVRKVVRARATLERQNLAGHGVVLIGQYHCDRACMHPRIPTTPSPPTLRTPELIWQAPQLGENWRRSGQHQAQPGSN